MPTANTPPPVTSQSWIAGLETDQYDANVVAAARLLLASGEASPSSSDRTTSWDYGAYVDTGENEQINTSAKREIAAGAEALLFRLYYQPDTEDIGTILDGIDLKPISLHCSLRYPGQDPAELFRDLVKYLRRAGHDLHHVSGSVDFDPLLDWSEPPFPPLIRLLFFVSRWMPEFNVLQVNAAGFNNGVAEADTELALALAKGAAYLRRIAAEGYPIALANKHLKFAFTVGTSFYGDVAKLRAFRALWTKVLEGMGLDNPPLAQIAAHTDITTMLGDQTADQLSLNLQALAADCGGADLVFLAPAEGMHVEATTARRTMTHDILQAFRSEDSLPDTIDLDQNYLDDLTVALVKAAWFRYKSIEDQGGFTEADTF